MPRAVQGQNTESSGVPAPIKGIVATGVYAGAGAAGASVGQGAVAAEGDTGVDSAIWLYNMVAGEYGCRVRPGTREQVTGLPDFSGPDGQVRSVMVYNSVVAGGANDHKFAVTSLGVFDITAGGAGPWTLGDRVSDLVFGNQGANAGWCSWVNYTNVAGDHFLLMCDEDNGYYIFDGIEWVVGTFTGNPTPTAESLVHIVEWNGRIWFVEKNTARAWFLDPLALTGTITPFDVGSRFKFGGHLVSQSTWTIDAGDGMDDKFVQVSAAGDVLVWQGVDPTTAADLTLVGRWEVGSVPEGRRVMSDWGGDVLLLSTSGIVSISTLLEGRAAVSERTAVSRNINQYIRSEMKLTLDIFGWSILQVPAQGFAIVTIPQPLGSSRAPIQFVLETGTGAWSMFRDLSIVSQTKDGSRYIFGTDNGRVMLLGGTLDNIDLAAETGEAIVFSLLTHYSGMGSAANWKRAQFMRPYWIGAQQPIFDMQIRYDFDLGEILTTPAYVVTGSAQWDSAIWDNALWEGTSQAYLETIGAKGMGRHAAIAIRGSATNELTYIGADVMFDTGGML